MLALQVPWKMVAEQNIKVSLHFMKHLSLCFRNYLYGVAEFLWPKFHYIPWSIQVCVKLFVWSCRISVAKVSLHSTKHSSVCEIICVKFQNFCLSVLFMLFAYTNKWNKWWVLMHSICSMYGCGYVHVCESKRERECVCVSVSMRVCVCVCVYVMKWVYLCVFVSTLGCYELGCHK